jgi:hypothetical protein
VKGSRTVTQYFSWLAGWHYTFDFRRRELMPLQMRTGEGLDLLMDSDEELWLDLVGLLYREASRSGGTSLSRIGIVLPKAARMFFIKVINCLRSNKYVIHVSFDKCMHADESHC